MKEDENIKIEFQQQQNINSPKSKTNANNADDTEEAEPEDSYLEPANVKVELPETKKKYFASSTKEPSVNSPVVDDLTPI